MEGEGSGGRGVGKWGERGREAGIGYPPVHPLSNLRANTLRRNNVYQRLCAVVLKLFVYWATSE